MDKPNRLGNFYGEDRGTGFAGNVWDKDSVLPTLTTCGGGNREPMVCDNENNFETNEETKKFRIRKLTPLECWRLMGFTDEDFLSAKTSSREIAKEILAKYPHEGKRLMSEAERLSRMSNTQLYKMAGNSIVTNVLYYIYIELYKAMPYLFDDLKVGSYFSGIGAFEKGLDMLYEDINSDSIPEKEDTFVRSNPFDELL